MYESEILKMLILDKSQNGFCINWAKAYLGPCQTYALQ